MLGEVDVLTTTIPSGAGTSSGVIIGGHRRAVLFIPVLTSAVISLIVPHPTGGAWVPVQTTASGLMTIGTLGQTGNAMVPLPSEWLFGGYGQEVRISAGAAQGADRNFVWHLKG